MASFEARLDTRAQEAWLKRYTKANVTAAIEDSAKAGAQEAVKVLRAAAPVGTSRHPSQYYRRNGLRHGTFRKSVKAAKIRGRNSGLTGLQANTVGYVLGPMGKTGFTRAWIEGGTNGPGRHHVAARPWVEHAAREAFSVAARASQARLEAYGRKT